MKKLKYVLLVCVLVVILLVIFINLNSKKDVNKIKTNDVNIDEVKSTIIKKVDIMSAKNIGIDLYKESVDIDTIDYTLITKNILLNLEDDGIISDKELNSYKECINSSYINKDTVDNMLKYIFGTLPDIDYDKVDNYIFDKENSRYFESCINKMNGSNFIDTYIYNFELNENEANLYIAVSYGVEQPIIKDDNITDSVKVIIYKDYKKKDKYKEYIYGTDTQTDDFILDESNYDNFSLYKYTFIKKDNDYYFKSLSRQ